MNELIGRKFPVLDQGYVILTDVMGDDSSIVQAARVSFGKGTKSVSDDRSLIRYLMRNHHGTPFEMCEIKLILRIPNGDTWRQMIRHRAGSIRDEASMWDEPSVNAYSYRYSEAVEVFRETSPDSWRLQVQANKQGSDGVLSEWSDDVLYYLCEPMIGSEAWPQFVEKYPTPGHYFSAGEKTLLSGNLHEYKKRLTAGVAREQARKDLPNSLYTDAYWKCDLRNVFHFLGLRMESHAQLEIRQYANVIGREIVASLFPMAWEAFEDYVLNAISLSSPDIDVIRVINRGCTVEEALKAVSNTRERDECRAKLVKLAMINSEE